MQNAACLLGSSILKMAGAFFRLTDIAKSYAGVQAVQEVNFAVSPGEVIGLVGENGAGKSTLMNIIGGVIEPSSGIVEIDGVQRKSLTVLESMGAGIAFVHQELNLFDNLDVASNVYIGREPLYGGPFRLVNRKKLNADVQPLLDRLGVDFTPETMVSDMSIAQRQLLDEFACAGVDDGQLRRFLIARDHVLAVGADAELGRQLADRQTRHHRP